MPIEFFRARRSLQLGVLALVVVSSVAAAARRTSFNDGWRFHKGDAAGAEQPAFDDTRWRALSLPHDWAIEGPFDSKYNPETGGLPIFGVAWYRKHFTVPVDGRGRYYSVEFDGCNVELHRVAEWPQARWPPLRL